MTYKIKFYNIPTSSTPHHSKSNPLPSPRLLELPLLMAERCWAYAMQLKEDSLMDNRKKFALRNKLRKAAGYSVAFQKAMEVSS